MDSPWTGLAITVVIGIVDWITRKSLSDTTILGLIGLALLSAIFPPLGIMMGAAVLVFLGVTRPQSTLGPFYVGNNTGSQQ